MTAKSNSARHRAIQCYIYFSLAFFILVLAGFVKFLSESRRDLEKKKVDNDGVKHHFDNLQPKQTEAIKYLERTLKEFLVSEEELPRKEVEMTVGALSLIFDTLKAKGLAEERIENGLKLIRNLYSTHSKQLVANFVNNLGVHFSKIKVDPKKSPALYFDESMALLEEALKLRINLFGESHPDIAESYINMAALLSYNKRDKERMVDLFKKAYDILHETLGQYDERTLTARAYWVDSQKL